jgi:mannitol 2-dehydrogenase
MKTGIVHIGVGGFHRSHEAHYTDELMGAGDLAEWGICGVSLREVDRKMWSVEEAGLPLYLDREASRRED